jgi:hypothetical protein
MMTLTRERKNKASMAINSVVPHAWQRLKKKKGIDKSLPLFPPQGRGKRERERKSSRREREKERNG